MRKSALHILDPSLASSFGNIKNYHQCFLLLVICCYSFAFSPGRKYNKSIFYNASENDAVQPYAATRWEISLLTSYHYSPFKKNILTDLIVAWTSHVETRPDFVPTPNNSYLRELHFHPREFQHLSQGVKHSENTASG